VADQRVISRSTNNRQARLTTGRPSGWMSPSLQSRIDNVYHWTRKLRKLAPISGLQVETVRFDTQKLVNPEITGVEYQQGELLGYEIREYVLEKWGRTCVYCGAKNVPLQLEHIVPRSRGGSNRVSNLTLSCEACNLAKGNRTAAEFGYPHLLDQAQQSLQDAAAVNATRYALGRALQATGLPVSFWSGGRTKYNRVRQGYPKDHWLDAACVGETGALVGLPTRLKPLTIKATGRGNRQRTLVDKYGFPRRDRKGHIVVKMRQKRVHGFQTGDIVKAVVPAGKQTGTHMGRVAVRASGSFRVGAVDGISWKYCSLVQRADGYAYS
jgi:5-methylcytosine-specific restriction endonuclease McrA